MSVRGSGCSGVCGALTSIPGMVLECSRGYRGPREMALVSTVAPGTRGRGLGVRARCTRVLQASGNPQAPKLRSVLLAVANSEHELTTNGRLTKPEGGPKR